MVQLASQSTFFSSSRRISISSLAAAGRRWFGDALMSRRAPCRPADMGRIGRQDNADRKPAMFYSRQACAEIATRFAGPLSLPGGEGGETRQRRAGWGGTPPRRLRRRPSPEGEGKDARGFLAMLPSFETQRLLVRPRQIGDLNACLAMDRDTAVLRYIDVPWRNAEEHRRFVIDRITRDYPAGLGYWSVVLERIPAAFLGWVLLMPYAAVGPEVEI